MIVPVRRKRLREPLQQDQDACYRFRMNTGTWIAIGVAIGVGIGSAMDNIASGIGIGIAIGIACSLAAKR